MKIVCISDTHSQHAKIKIPEGDIIIHSGDATMSGSADRVESFLQWYGSLDFKKRILVAGNHDWLFELNPEKAQGLCDQYGITLLNDSGTEYEGIKIWGSPVQPTFFNWAFNRSVKKDDPFDRHPYIGDHWDKIPNDTNILITHGPPYCVLDETEEGDKTGCQLLLAKIAEVKPVLHVFGHIHEARGVVVDKRFGSNITYCNASSVDRKYRLYPFKPYVFEWEKLKKGESKGEDN